ncbi:hypothetical protein [Prosthecochloris sp. HL-130-GSB]|jgi:hypothetical protein|uniref:Uncharacterized protein n=1 Tax=Prosthecochloris aestuarii TaxID=1102 RepID=A0A831SUP7_PROAE|nr:hypothetical protein B9H02_10500 [Prosthecochloris sp. HL-130-GSB]MBO8093108.1 hypothetical protein [Prosthecochloris sp.]HED31967.1 hypothetical protein [Prosthecochloris aestuarii]
MVSDDFDEVLDEPNFNNPNTSPEPPSPYADLEKKYRKNKFNKKKSNYYPELYGTSGISVADGSRATGNKSRKKNNGSRSRKKSSSRNGRHISGK